MQRYGTEGLRRLVTGYLEEAGYDVGVSDDMDRWRAEMARRGAFVSPQFDPRYCRAERARWIGVWRDGALSATIAWRILDAPDMVEAVESGRFLYDAPEETGFVRYETGLKGVIRIGGRICHRGGLHSWDPGARLSWYIGSLMLAHGLEDGCDLAMSTAFPDIVKGGLPFKLYGYANQNLLPLHWWPNLRSWVQIVLVWSTAAQMREELEHRARFLAARGDHDLRRTVDAFDPGHKAGEYV